MQKRFMYIAILLLAICNKIVAEDLITISDIIMYSGGTKEVNVVMTNTDSYVGFQFDMVLPEGITVESFSASERISQGTSLQMAQQTDGSYRFIAYAQNRLPITGNDGAIMTLTIKASESVVPNSYSGYLRDVKISTVDGTGPTVVEQSFSITVKGAEPYAALSENNTVLTFYYDKKKEEHGGMSVGPFSGYVQRGWHSVRSSIAKVVFDDSFAMYSPTSTALWFWGLQTMTEIIGLENLHTDQVTDMNGMFHYCYALETLDLSNFNTATVTNIAGMFYGCNKLKTITVGEGWTTDNIITTTISGTGGNGGWQVFSQCTSLVGGAGTKFDASHTDYTYAHIDGGPSNPGYLTEKLDYNDGDLFTAKTIEGVTLTFVVTNASEKKCFVASNDRNTYMDTSTTGVVTIPSIARGYTVEALSNGAFKGCASVTEFKLPETLVLIECDAFRNCTGLTTVHIPASVTGIENQPLPWPGCTGITSITVDPENPIFDSRDNCNAIFTTADSTLYVGCKVSTIPESTRSIGHSAFDSMGELPALVLPAGLRSITAYAFWACSFPSVTSYIEEPFETSCVWDHLPEECPLYVPKGKVDAYRALSEWNNFTTIVEIGSSITPEPYAVLSEDNTVLTFYYDEKKTARAGIDINSSNLGDSPSPYGTATSAVFDASFANYYPTSTAYWFQNCSALTSISGIDNLKTDNVTSMSGMFSGCSSLTTLDLSNFNTSLVVNMNDMFANSTSLTTIYVADKWTTEAVESNFAQTGEGTHRTFQNCTQLVGGAGTKYDENDHSAFKAHIDGGPSNPGYLTDINGSTLNDGDTFTAVNSDGIELRYRVISAADKTCQVGDKADSNTLSPDDIASAVDTTVVGIINVPEQANGYKVVRVGYQAFVNCRNVTEVVLPNTVTELYLYSFAYSGIKRFTLPRSVSIIHYAALTETDSLETIIVDSENPVFDSRNNCNAIIETASNTLVRGCITSFVPDGITAIGSGAFLSCCAHDWTIELPNSVTRIETQAFNSCDLTDIKLSNNLQYVGYSAFGGSKLTSVVIPASVTEMGIGAFSVNSLTSLVVDEANSVFDSRDNCNAIIETATNTLVCGLPVTIIPNSVTAIGRDAFRELWNLNTITLPSSITRIDDHAFWYSNLDTIISLIEKPFEISDKVFHEDLYKRCELYVPAGTVDAYRSTSGWNLFQNILEINPSHGGPEPYAVLSDNNTVLTFYYDEKKNERNGIAIGSYGPGNYEPWYENRTTLTTAVFDESFANDTTLTSTAYWFFECIRMTEIKGLEYLKTDKVTDMRNMFYGCSKLTTLDVSHLKTDNVTNMNLMFYYCSGLTSLDVKGFNTENVTDMGSMFNNCSGLTSLDISSFKTEKVKDMIQMFYQCYNLTTIYAGNSWSTVSVTADYGYHMFTDCTALVGGRGTTYDANHIDYTYAHIDGGSNNPGYFTDKNASDLKDGDTFTAVNSDGVELRYMVVSAADKTCQVGDKPDSNIISSKDVATAVDTSYVGTIRIPEEAMGYRVVKVGFEAFYNCRHVTLIEMPNSVSMVTLAAFENSGITEITIPSSVTYFDGHSLGGCKNLKSIVVDSQNPVYDSRNGCNAIIRTSSNTLVRGCATTKLTEKDGIIAIGAGAFLGCKGQEWSMVLPNTIISIETQAFNSCDLTAITLPSSLQTIGSYVFSGSKILSLVVPASVTDIGKGSFHTSTMTSLVVDADNATFDSRDNCNAIIETATNKLVCGISTSVIPESVTTIGTYAFDELYNLKSVTLPASISKIEDRAFWCSGLKSITSLIENPFDISEMTFDTNLYNTCELRVPVGTSDVYRSTPYWSHFTNIVEMAPAIEATFDSNGVLAVNGSTTLADALSVAGGRAEVAKTITAIVWNSTATLTNDDLQGLDNPNMLIYVKDAALAPANRYNVVIGDFAKNIVLTDVSEGNGNFYCPQAFTAEKVNYVREFRQQTVVGVSRGWESIALPFTVQTISHEKQGAIAPFGNSASKKHFWLRRLGDSGLTQATAIEANVPYVISMPNDEVNYAEEFNLSGRVTFAAQEVTIPVTEPVTLALADSTIKMVPAFHGIGRASDVWAINVGESRDQYLEGSVFERDYREVRPFEAYTVHTGEGPAPRFVLITEIGGTTGIEDVRGLMSDGRGDKWYDLNGRRLQQKPTQKGVYLNNGRKVIIR